METVLIFGVTGQTGSYLAEIISENPHNKVVGVTRRSSTPNTHRLSSLLQKSNFEIVEGDVTDCFCIANLINKYKPTVIYNMAAQSHVATSFKQPALTWEVTAGGCLNILEAIRTIDTKIKFYQASSSEMFGKNFNTKYVAVNPPAKNFDDVLKTPIYDCIEAKYQDENTPFMPQSPYAIAKLAAHNLVRNYRESYGIFACSGILFNHESPRRGEQFVTRKITKWIGEYLANPIKDYDFPKLRLGNLEAKRDWGHAKDYAKAIESMMNQEAPDDYVISTQETHTVREFLEVAFDYAGLGSYEKYIAIDQEFFRPSEVDFLLGDSSKARKALNWKPSYSFLDLVKEMVDSDIEEAKKKRS